MLTDLTQKASIKGIQKEAGVDEEFIVDGVEAGSTNHDGVNQNFGFRRLKEIN
ncbi:hypothetical protein COLO4_09896 [Corchorus olitorius]|uniref:Uncharacterized protein n=1 Tax=Corchorus olitorius TaxID=93759 RepID=A0A1R3KAS4_9ROSI|nr:hypothetical protein COLO4_09896 [Corchorus olitorius]